MFPRQKIMMKYIQIHSFILIILLFIFILLINYINNLPLLLSVPTDESISFEIGVASFVEDPDDKEMWDSNFSIISTYEKTAENHEDVF